MGKKLTRETELMIFKAVNRGTIDKLVGHTNFMDGNAKKSALYNQGVQRGKLKRIIEWCGKDIANWRAVQVEKPCGIDKHEIGVMDCE